MEYPDSEVCVRGGVDKHLSGRDLKMLRVRLRKQWLSQLSRELGKVR